MKNDLALAKIDHYGLFAQNFSPWAFGNYYGHSSGGSDLASATADVDICWCIFGVAIQKHDFMPL